MKQMHVTRQEYNFDCFIPDQCSCYFYTFSYFGKIYIFLLVYQLGGNIYNKHCKQFYES